MRFIKIRSLFVSLSVPQFHRATTLRTPRELPATAQTEKVLFVNIPRLYTLRPTLSTLHQKITQIGDFICTIQKNVVTLQVNIKNDSLIHLK